MVWLPPLLPGHVAPWGRYSKLTGGSILPEQAKPVGVYSLKRVVFAEVVTRIPYHGAILSDDTPVTDVTSTLIWTALGAFADPAVVTTVAFTVRV